MSANTDTLESMCELIVDCPHSTPKWTDKGIIVLRNQNIKKGALDLSSPSFTNEEDYQKRIKRAVPQAGDIVFTREAPMGEVCMIPDGLKCCLGQRQVLLRPKSDVCGEYLFWALQSPFVQHQISWNEGTGSTVSNVRIPVLKALNIPRHHDEEEHIAKVLSDLAGKIELNRQTNQTLEHIAQAIFKSWFVDFEPTRAKIAAKQIGRARQDGERSAALREALLSEGRWPSVIAGAIAEGDPERAAMAAISGKSLEELDQLSPEQQEQLKTTAALFPDALVDSELGEIPEGWDAKPLGEYLEIKRGGSPRPIKEFIVEKGLPWTKIADATSEPSPFIFRTKECIKEEGLKKTVLLKKGTLILSNSATPGLPKFLQLDACIHDGWLHFPERKLFSDVYLYQLFLEIRKLLVAQGNGSVFTNLKTDILRNQVVVAPPQDLVNKFDDTVELIFRKLKENCDEINTLSEIRDSLLTKLLSGELAIESTQTDLDKTA